MAKPPIILACDLELGAVEQIQNMRVRKRQMSKKGNGKVVVLKIDYVEFDSVEMEASRDFFAQAFGWKYTEYGPDYLAIDNGGLEGGIGRAESGKPSSLVILKSDDLEATQKSVEAAGGKIIREIFSFPGGRRFHFREPGGNELAVWSTL